jgi:hypothetical protein
MATIKTFGRLEQGNERPTADCSAKIVCLDLNGELFVQLNSYGSDNRKFVGARSQNMRLTKTAFEQLVEAGDRHFGIKR